MTKQIYELPIARNYVHSWSVEDAVRELMQNAIDSQADGHLLHINYSSDIGELEISNTGCSLDISSLVLGNTNKNDPTKYIGHYGEGFKLAMIVLLRNDIQVTLFTNKQRWEPDFQYSKNFNTETLHIEVAEHKSRRADIILYRLRGISPEVFNEIRENNLVISTQLGYNIGEVLETEYGQILLHPQFKGKMFVKGLYVSSDSSFQYGYNFKPEYVPLDRDRRAIGYWQLRALTAKAMLSQADVKLVYTSLTKSYTDTRDLRDYLDESTEEFKVNFAHEFIKTHELDEDTFVGLEKELLVVDKPKKFKTDSKVIAELVNAGLGRTDEYKTIQDKADKLTVLESAEQTYNASDFKILVDFLYDNNDVLDTDSVITMLNDVSKLYPTGFNLIKDKIFAKFMKGSDSDD